MDIHFALHTSHPGCPSGSPGPQTLDGASLSLDLSWLAAKDDPLFHDISPIDCGSDETGSETNARNSFRSVAQDASFLQFFTTVRDALNHCATARVRRTSRLFGVFHDFQCEALVAKCTVTREYAVLQNGCEVARVRRTGPGAFCVHTHTGAGAHVAYFAKARNGHIRRKADVRCYGPTRRLAGRGCQGKDCALTEDGCERLVLKKTTKGEYELRFSQISQVLAFGIAVSSLIQHNH